jgi:hypothetical protein
MQFFWNVINLERRTSDGFVHCAHWECKVTDGNLSESICETSYWADADLITPYENLTEQQVLEWIWAGGIDKQNFEKKLVAKIDTHKNPMSATGLPW